MTCSVDDQSLNPITPSLSPIPGFGVPISPTQFPLPGFDLPAEMIEDVLGLINSISAVFPSGTFKGNYDLDIRTAYSVVSNILSQIAPFLSIYNFFLALLKMPVCLLNIVCAFPNPFAMAEKLKELFVFCVPDYLKLFPPLSLLVMIISILLLLLKLIEYMILQIVGIIEQIINNLKEFGNAVSYQNAESMLAVAKKIAALFCEIKNLLAILSSLNVIFQIIETIAKTAVPLICDDDDTGCCGPSLCPSFIKKTPDGIIVTQGTLVYTREVSVDVASVFGITPELAAAVTIPPLRSETWQLYDAGSSDYQIILISTPVEPLNNIFYPEEVSFNKSTPPKRAPYTVDLTININPDIFGINDGYGPRTFLVKDCIVTALPYQGVYDYQNEIQDAGDGTLQVQGGLVYVDGSPYYINGVQGTLNTFIHQAALSSTSLPGADDQLTFSVEFTWKPNAPALVGFNLTTLGCIPEVAAEKEVVNQVSIDNGIVPLDIRLPKVNSTSFLPDVSGTLDCVTSALAIFRANVTAESAATFQAAMTVCLGTLTDQTSAALCNSLSAAVSVYTTSVELVPDTQFTSRPVIIQITLKDASGTPVAAGINDTCSSQLAESLSATATLGTVGEFVYDGSGLFKANLTSEKSGSGVLKVFYNGSQLATYVPGPPSSIVLNSYDYTFVDAGQSSMVRRDASDVALA